MGDNIYLGDRDGVRTPMQWTGDRNGGFSRADFAQLYLPPLMDPVYGYQARERRGAAAHADLAAALAAPLHRAAQGAPGVRARHLRAAAAREPADLRARPPLRGRRRALRPQPRPLGAGGRARPAASSTGWVPEEMFGRTRFPRDRRAAVPADARAARLLLVPAAGRPRSDEPRADLDRARRCSSTCTQQRWFGSKAREVAQRRRASTRACAARPRLDARARRGALPRRARTRPTSSLGRRRRLDGARPSRRRGARAASDARSASSAPIAARPRDGGTIEFRAVEGFAGVGAELADGAR